MKVKILYTALISLIAGGAMAQDCTFFFPQTEGTVWVRKGYDAKEERTILRHRSSRDQ